MSVFTPGHQGDWVAVASVVEFMEQGSSFTGEPFRRSLASWVYKGEGAGLR